MSRQNKKKRQAHIESELKAVNPTWSVPHNSTGLSEASNNSRTQEHDEKHVKG